MCMITDAILTIFKVWTDEAAKVSKYILRFLATGFLYKKIQRRAQNDFGEVS